MIQGVGFSMASAEQSIPSALCGLIVGLNSLVACAEVSSPRASLELHARALHKITVFDENHCQIHNNVAHWPSNMSKHDWAILPGELNANRCSLFLSFPFLLSTHG